MSKEDVLYTLEQKLISPNVWSTSVPSHIRKLAKESWDIPHGIGQSEQFGWFIIGTAGQGPFIIYVEYQKEWDKLL